MAEEGSRYMYIIGKTFYLDKDEISNYHIDRPTSDWYFRQETAGRCLPTHIEDRTGQLITLIYKKISKLLH